jgi:selenocysteine lyase/cysteine desulfurase
MTAGKRNITAEAAYGANAVAFLHAERTVGVRVEVVPSDGTGQLDVSALAQAVGSGDDVALIAVTHVPTNGGLINPAAEVGALARAAGVPYLLDACQSVGQLDLDVTDLQCDLLSATGRKYLRGPRGSGFLYVSENVLERLLPSRPDHKSAHWVSDRHYEFAAGAERFEHWEYNHAAWLGLGTAVDEAMAIGLDRIEATVRRQGSALRQALTDAGFPVFDLGAERCGIVTTNIDGIGADVAKKALSTAGINTSVTTPDSTRWDFDRRNLGPMLRLSVHATTTDDEIARSVDALANIGG